MINIKMQIEYDGSAYNGWQKQKNTAKTLQETLENAIQTTLKESCEVAGSGRTDKGVHAKGQVVTFACRNKPDFPMFLHHLNETLPSDIRVKSVEVVPRGFHARLSATGKTYVYYISAGEDAEVFQRKYTYYIEETLCLEKMRQAAQRLVGTHDFIGFSSLRKEELPENASTIRTISDILIEEEGHRIKITYKGNGFLYNMVRILTGTLIEVGMGKREATSVDAVIIERNRQLAGFTAPPQGLFLWDVNYDKE
ncbi:MAG: tRNA pseudouridine(38-40) synthase TruA [Lachnospiraceae bacterium]|nr:tRNA pseudouridine(38-40) synthase TruA [Lachnospiraceae bacterium]